MQAQAQAQTQTQDDARAYWHNGIRRRAGAQARQNHAGVVSPRTKVRKDRLPYTSEHSRTYGLYAGCRPERTLMPPPPPPPPPLLPSPPEGSEYPISILEQIIGC